MTSRHGKEAVIDVLHKGDFFGESALHNSQLRRPTNAVALTELQTIRIGRDSLLRLLHSHPEICDAFISGLVRLIAQLRSTMARHLLYSSEHRLANALLSVAHLDEHEEFHRIPKISQQDLASMIGVTRQRVNFLLKRFRELGFVDYAGGLRVHSSIRTAAWED